MRTLALLLPLALLLSACTAKEVTVPSSVPDWLRPSAEGTGTIEGLSDGMGGSWGDGAGPSTAFSLSVLASPSGERDTTETVQVRYDASTALTVGGRIPEIDAANREAPADVLDFVANRRLTVSYVVRDGAVFARSIDVHDADLGLVPADRATPAVIAAAGYIHAMFSDDLASAGKWNPRVTARELAEQRMAAAGARDLREVVSVDLAAMFASRDRLGLLLQGFEGSNVAGQKRLVLQMKRLPDSSWVVDEVSWDDQSTH